VDRRERPEYPPHARRKRGFDPRPRPQAKLHILKE